MPLGCRHLQSPVCKAFRHVKVDTLSQPEAFSRISVPGTGGEVWNSQRGAGGGMGTPPAWQKQRHPDPDRPQTLLFSRRCSVAQSCPTPCDLMDSPDLPGRNTGVGCHFLLQGIFLTQG